jgi:hypothetical protein
VPGWSGAENLATPTGFDPLTVQPVTIRYTDWVLLYLTEVILCFDK